MTHIHTMQRRPPGRPALAGLTAAALALLLGWGAPAEARDWPVPSSAHPTIASALAGAEAGDRIVIAPGTYRERLVVERAVTLTGRAGATPPVIDGGGEGRVVELRAPGSAVSRLVLQHSGDNLSDTDACLYVTQSATGARASGNVLRDCAFGVWVNGTTGAHLEGNRITGRPKPVFSNRGNGINLWQIRDGVIRGNVIEQVRDGIYLSVTKDSLVAGNRMRDLRFGVHYMYSDRNDVVDNLTCGSQVGLALMFSKRLHILGNTALDNRDHGILFRSIYDSRIRGNRVEGNGKGFFLNDSSFNRITGNRVADNAIGVHVTGGSEDNTVTGNTFAHNPVQVRFAWNRSIHWDHGGRGNYWSDYLGWDLDGDGRGDRPHYATGAMDRLLVRYPELKVLAMSPVVWLMQSLENRFPVMRPPSIIDRHPAMHPLPLDRGQEGPRAVRADGPDSSQFCGNRGGEAVARATRRQS